MLGGSILVSLYEAKIGVVLSVAVGGVGGYNAPLLSLLLLLLLPHHRCRYCICVIIVVVVPSLGANGCVLLSLRTCVVAGVSIRPVTVIVVIRR